MSALLDTFPECPGLRLDDLVLTPNLAVALVASTSATAACPRCGTPSQRVHSHYRRTVADLPCHDRRFVLRLLVRRFRCIDASCPRHIFCERLPGLLAAHARSTTRLTGAHCAIGFALGGEAGNRLAEHLDMPTSPDTLLRHVKSIPGESSPPPRYVGVDDWAIRKGHRNDTILIDLERGRVLDILPGGGPGGCGAGTAGQTPGRQGRAARSPGPGSGVRGDGAEADGGAAARVAGEGGGIGLRRVAELRGRAAAGRGGGGGGADGELE
jgi:hypothetical protein